MASKIAAVLQSVAATPYHIFYSEAEKHAILELVGTLLEQKNTLHRLKRNQREIVRLCLYLTLGCNGWQFTNPQKTGMAELLRIIDMVDRVCAYKDKEISMDSLKEVNSKSYDEDCVEEKNDNGEEEEVKEADVGFENEQLCTIIKNLRCSMRDLAHELANGKPGENRRNSDWYWDYSSMRDHSAAASDLVMGKNLATPAISEPYRWIGAIAGTDMFDKDRTRTVEFIEEIPGSQSFWKKHLFLHSCFNERMMKINPHTMQMVEFVTGTKIYVTIRALPKVQYRFTLVSVEKRRIYAAVGMLQCVFNHNIQFSMENMLNICHLISRAAPNRTKIIHCATEIPPAANSLAVNCFEHPRVVQAYLDTNSNNRKRVPLVNNTSDAQAPSVDDGEFRLIIPQRHVCKFNSMIEFDKKFTNRLIGTDAAITLLIEHVAHVAISFHRVPGKNEKRQVSIHSMRAANLFAAANFIELLLHYNLGFEVICCTILRNPHAAERLLGKLNSNEMGPWKFSQLKCHPVWNPDNVSFEEQDNKAIDPVMSVWLNDLFVDYSPKEDAEEVNQCKCGVSEARFDDFVAHSSEFQVSRSKQEHLAERCDPLGLRSID